MGDFKIEATICGGHGCDRKAKPGETLQPCGRFGCLDCEFREWLKRFPMVKGAKVTHWPDTPEQVVDELRGKEAYADGRFLVPTRASGSFVR